MREGNGSCFTAYKRVDMARRHEMPASNRRAWLAAASGLAFCDASCGWRAKGGDSRHLSSRRLVRYVHGLFVECVWSCGLKTLTGHSLEGSGRTPHRGRCARKSAGMTGDIAVIDMFSKEFSFEHGSFSSFHLLASSSTLVSGGSLAACVM